MRKLWLIGLLGLFLSACSVGESPTLDGDLEAQACQPVISMDRVMELLRDTRSKGRAIPKSEWITAGAIAKAESGLCVRARGSNTNGSVDRGLFQINSIHPYSPSCLYNETCNVRAAINIYRERGNWSAWVTYNRGLHRRHLAAARAAFNRVIGGSGSCTWPKVKAGSEGRRVKQLQYFLKSNGNPKLDVDGKFGPKTEKAVRKFQKAHKLSVDGVVGPDTWSKLTFKRRRGDKGNAVRVIQIGVGLKGKEVDGIFGEKTEKAVKRHQKRNKLEVDGVVGPNTWPAVLFGPGCKHAPD